MAVKRDLYTNRAIGNIAMSAANVLTFEKMEFGVGIFQGVALVMHKVDFYPTTTSLREIVAATDYMVCALTTSDQIADIGDIQAAVIAQLAITGIGVAVASIETPLSVDFSQLPGGGYILPPNPIYMAMDTTGAVAASAYRVRIYFSFVELADKDYIELIQAQLPANM